MDINELGYYLYMDSMESKEDGEVNNKTNPFLVCDVSTNRGYKKEKRENPKI